MDIPPPPTYFLTIQDKGAQVAVPGALSISRILTTDTFAFLYNGVQMKWSNLFVMYHTEAISSNRN